MYVYTTRFTTYCCKKTQTLSESMFGRHVHPATVKRQLIQFIRKIVSLICNFYVQYLLLNWFKNEDFRPFFGGNDALSIFPIHHGESVSAQCPVCITGFVDSAQLTDFPIKCLFFAHF